MTPLGAYADQMSLVFPGLMNNKDQWHSVDMTIN